MRRMTVALTFVDTNVLLYAVDKASGSKGDAAREWLTWCWRTRNGRISVQVVNEFCVNGQKLFGAKGFQLAQREIREYFVWQPTELSLELVQSAWAVQDRYRLSYWDSLIVASALDQRCTQLLTEDLQDGQHIDQLVVCNPFNTKPPQ
jgi:predicted nucleic acid-binding protein